MATRRKSCTLRYRMESNQLQEPFADGYGLKQSSRCWNKKNVVLLKLVFSKPKIDYCLYTSTNKNDQVYFVLYVDDLLVVGRIRTKQQLSYEFECRTSTKEDFSWSCRWTNTTEDEFLSYLKRTTPRISWTNSTWWTAMRWKCLGKERKRELIWK